MKKLLLLNIMLVLITFFSYSDTWYSKHTKNIVDSRIPSNVVVQEYYYTKLTLDDDQAIIIIIKDIRIDSHLMQRFYAHYTLYKNDDYYVTYDQIFSYQFIMDEYHNKLYCIMVGNTNEIVFTKNNNAIEFDK